MAQAAIQQVLDGCQKSFVVHKQGLEKFQKLKQKTRDFDQLLLQEVYRMLLVWKKEASVDRLCQFIIKFVTDSRNEDLAIFFLYKLIDLTDVKDKAVRYRACLIIKSILNQLGTDAEIE